MVACVYNSGILEALAGFKGSLNQVDRPPHQMEKLIHSTPSVPLSPPTTSSPTLHDQDLNPSPPTHPIILSCLLNSLDVSTKILKLKRLIK